jgi:hypothetical protein
VYQCIGISLEEGCSRDCLALLVLEETGKNHREEILASFYLNLLRMRAQPAHAQRQSFVGVADVENPPSIYSPLSLYREHFSLLRYTGHGESVSSILACGARLIPWSSA